MADPIEGQNYGTTDAIFHANNGKGKNSPLIYSFAHGSGTTYYLVRNKAILDNNLITIKVTGGTLPMQVIEAEKALIAEKVEIYQRCGSLVRPIRLHKRKKINGVTLYPGTMILWEVTRPWLVNRMTKSANFVRGSKKDEEYPIDCPSVVAETYMANVGDWNVSEMFGIASCPTMLEDGTLASFIRDRK